MKIVSGEVRVVPFIAGTGGVANGDLVVASSGTVVKAESAPTAGTVVGVAVETVDAGELAMVDVIGEGTLVTAVHTGSTKTSLDDDDIGSVFDISDEVTVNLDDTTGGCCSVVSYDNDVEEVSFVVPASFRYL